MKRAKPQKIEPENWTLEAVSEDDKKLPKPRGGVQPKKKIDPKEEWLLETTRANGGLLKERWRWTGGKPVFEDYIVKR